MVKVETGAHRAEERIESLPFVLQVKSAELIGKFDMEGGGIEVNQRQFLYFSRY